MSLEQWLLRGLLLAPAVLVCLAWLPIANGGFQFMGLTDGDFLASGTLDIFRLAMEALGLLVVFQVLEQYAKNAMDYFNPRDARGRVKQARGARRAPSDMPPFRAALAFTLALVCALVPIGFATTAWSSAQVSIIGSAAKQGNLAKVKALVAADHALLDAPGYLGRTPLWWAAFGGRTPVITYLLNKHANANRKDARGWPPLHAAAFRNQGDAISLLCDYKAKLAATDHQGRSVLHTAALGPNTDAAMALLSRGVDINATDTLGWTPLHVAAQHQQLEMTTFLLDNGAAVNAKTSDGSTPLVVANTIKQNDVIKDLLLERGGN